MNERIPDPILADMYGLNERQAALWNDIHELIDKALEQFDNGYAADVEAETTELVKRWLA
jgi:hypothetical protein